MHFCIQKVLEKSVGKLIHLIRIFRNMERYNIKIQKNQLVPYILAVNLPGNKSGKRMVLMVASKKQSAQK